MSFLSVLKAIGKGVLSIGGIINSPLGKAVETLLPASVQPAVNVLNGIAVEIGAAEAVGEAVRNQLAGVTVTGGVLDVSLAKAQAVLPSVQAIMKQAEFVSGRKIADEARFAKGCQEILNGMVDVLDSLEHPNG